MLSNFGTTGSPAERAAFSVTVAAMARARTLVAMAALLLAPIAGVTEVSGAAEVRAAKGPSLRLAVTPAVWDTGTKPLLDLHFVNDGKRAVQVVSPLDGSWDGMREPAYTLELLDPSGVPITDALGPVGGRCGLSNPLQPAEDIRVVLPGASVNAHASTNSFPFHAEVGEAARPGEYLAQVRYRSALPGASALELVSNQVKVTIRGGSMPLWNCWHAHETRAASFVEAGSMPHDLQALGDGQALLYVRSETTRIGGKQQRKGELFLQRLGPAGARLMAASLTRWPGLAHARALPIDGGLLVAYTVDERSAGGRQSLYLLKLRAVGDALHIDTPKLHTADLANAYNISLARAGDTLAVLYLKNDGPDKSAVMIHLLDATGTAIAAPQRLATAAYLADARLASGPRGFWATYSTGPEITVVQLGPGGRPASPAVVLKERLGSIDAVWPQDGSFALEYHKSFTLGSVPNDKMGYYLQSFDPGGRKRSAAVALSPASASDPHWGSLARSDAGAVRVHGVERIDRSGRRMPVSDLMFGPVGRDARKLSSTLVGEPRVHALGDDFFAAWSDARDDRSRACERLGACVGEVYVASWKRGQQPLLAPTRVTHGAVPRPPVSDDGRWRELCD